jgi:Tfp pilus assembly major pilin PilA
MRDKQKGLTLIGFAMVLAVVGFFAYAAMKLVPAYTEYFGVVKSMKAIADEPNAAALTIEEIRRKLDLNFSVQYVDESSIPVNGIKLETQGGARRLHIQYDRVLPFLYNVSILVHFDHSEDLTRASAAG